MKNILKVFIIGILILNYGCAGSGEQTAKSDEPVEVMPTGPEISAEQTQAVLEHHLGAFGENDLAGIMADYTDESMLVTPDLTFVGLAQIESLFTGLLADFPTEGTVFEMDKMVIEGDLAYIIWHASTPTVVASFGTDTFIIQDGKIVKQTFAGIINPV